LAKAICHTEVELFSAAFDFTAVEEKLGHSAAVASSHKEVKILCCGAVAFTDVVAVV
jgi:hypothetical protein